ncbi:MAG: hypothetical protein E7409_00945 [Ruminococcaceae bacterium]|nr:hypothetical protein [Oscillospiraceae bacterium]
MKEKKAKKPFNRAKFNYRLTSGVVCVLVIAVVIIVNILFGALGEKVNTKIDLTHDRILDFSDQTIQTLKNLDQEVRVYNLIPEDTGVGVVESVENVLDRYKQLSSKIKYERIDVAKNPVFMQKYQTSDSQFSNYCFIFETDKKFKVVDLNDTVVFNNQTGDVNYISAEQKFTNAIAFVTSDTETKVAVVEGHGETSISTFEGILTDANYTVQSINLTSQDIPDDVSVLVISAPQNDYSGEEIDKIDRFFDRGGDAQIFWGILQPALPNLEGYLAEWGVKMHGGFALDTSTNRYVPGVVQYLLPEVVNTDITSQIAENGLMVVLKGARGFDLTEVPGVEAQVLLKGSENSFVRVGDSQTFAYEEGDVRGPVNLAVHLSHLMENDTTNIMVVGTSGLVDADAISGGVFANLDFYLNTLSAMTNKSDDVYIRPKDVSTQRFATTPLMVIIFGGITVVIIPLIIIVLGIVIWMRRRHL